ncbi:MAG: hypothetical protein L6U99_01005 [Clostridium sp.]|nr:MAG: hypothetical protein L6U99_01005 [Clostridium sp.]
MEIPATAYGDYTYDGTIKHAVISSYDTSKVNRSGIESATNVGTYNVIFTIKDEYRANFCFSEDEDVSSITRTWTISKLKLELPTQTTDFIYDGTEKQAYMNHVDLTYMKVVNPTWKATNVGEYTVTYQLLDTNNTCWINDSIADRVVTWRIRQATPSITTNPTTETMTYSNNLGKYLLNGGVADI